jgi:hypothetical protein
VRDDVQVDVLLLTFTATVHALIGQPGVQGRGKPKTRRSAALDGLMRLIEPPAGAGRRS